MRDRSTPVLLTALFWLVPAVAQVPPPPPDQPPPATQSAPPQTEAPQSIEAPPRYRDPYQAYDAGAYDQALQGFVDRQVERPDDPTTALNVGAAHYQMRNFAEAEKSFGRAALSADLQLRQRALYNLGNTAFRQGRLEEAVGYFQGALDLDPDDQDAKFNLEFVRDEIRRRHEEAKKRQEEQQQQPQDQEQQQEEQQQEGQQPQEESGEGQQPPGADSDQDGLPDQTEEQGANPTDPNNPDSDQDGLQDGQEDQNRNGQVDEGETDPNNPDSDGDGLSDGEEAAQQAQRGEQGDEADEQGLTEEEAERYLQALEDARPDPKRPKSGQRARPEKDW